ncbi:MAG: class I SAM-dependent methyltransferase [Candidatus Nomurabacteria bacterium]|nr:class I SAM-dependent methyltransferase [Candidatus Nomurabacteria bacterium]
MIWAAAGVVLAAILGVSLLFGAPYVPSRKRDIEQAFTDILRLTSKDTIVDMGCGDGVVLKLAVAHGAKAVGYEVNPLLVVISKIRLGKKAIIKWQNGLKAKWPAGTTVVYVFGVERIMAAVAEKARQHAEVYGKAIKVVSYGFEIPGKKPERTVGAYHLYKF